MKKVKYLLASIIVLLIMPVVANAALKVGDYVEMVPTKTSYELPQSYTNSSSNRTINPSELKLWRIIKINNDGTIEAVSEYTSSDEIKFSGNEDGEIWLNYIAALKLVAKAYENSEFTTGSRIFGYYQQHDSVTVTYLPWDNEGNLATPTYCQIPQGVDMFELENGLCGDNMYQVDENLVGSVYKSDTSTYGTTGLKAYKVGNSQAVGYWVASRAMYYDSYLNPDNFYYVGTIVNANGVIDRDTAELRILGDSRSVEVKSAQYYIRPIVVLKSGLYTTEGSGTKASPYKLSATAPDQGSNNDSSNSGQTTPTTKKETTNDEISVKESDTVDLSKTVSDPTKYTWKSSDESVATVDSKGKVTIKKSGTVSIIAENDTEKITNKLVVYKTPTSKTSSNGVSLLTNDDLTDKDVEAKIEKIDIDSDTYKTIKSKVTNVEKMTVYDIKLLKDGSKVQPNGEVVLEFDIPSGYDKTKIAVYRVEDSGTLTRLAAKIVNGKIQVKTNHFSYYVIAQLNTTTGIEESSAVVSKASTTTENPTTGQTISIIVVAILTITGTAIYFYTKKKNALYRI